MMFAAEIFRECSSGLSLSVGRAAAHFTMELARSARWHQLLSQGSAWIGSLFGATPGLSAGVQYDGVLVPLVNAILSPKERQSPHPIARRSPARPALVSSRGRSPGTADFHGGTGTPAAVAGLTSAGLASRARAVAGAAAASGSRDLPGIAQTDLIRLARSSGGAAATVTRQGRLPSANSYAYRRESGTAAAGVVAESVVPAAAAAGGLPTPAAIRDWQSRMVERVRGRLRSSSGGYGAAAAASHALQDVWGLAIDGPAASPELLLPDAGSCAASANTVFHDADSVSAAEPFISSAAPPSIAAGPAGTELAANVGRPAVLENVVASPEGAALAALQVLGEELLSKATDDLWMPSLIPSRRPGGETPSTVSPACISRTEIAPLSQEMDLGEDLTALSLKMRRVLNEEARRHGIDV